MLIKLIIILMCCIITVLFSNVARRRQATTRSTSFRGWSVPSSRCPSSERPNSGQRCSPSFSGWWSASSSIMGTSKAWVFGVWSRDDVWDGFWFVAFVLFRCCCCCWTDWKFIVTHVVTSCERTAWIASLESCELWIMCSGRRWIVQQARRIPERTQRRQQLPAALWVHVRFSFLLMLLSSSSLFLLLLLSSLLLLWIPFKMSSNSQLIQHSIVIRINSTNFIYEFQFKFNFKTLFCIFRDYFSLMWVLPCCDGDACVAVVVVVVVVVVGVVGVGVGL